MRDLFIYFFGDRRLSLGCALATVGEGVGARAFLEVYFHLV